MKSFGNSSRSAVPSETSPVERSAGAGASTSASRVVATRIPSAISGSASHAMSQQARRSVRALSAMGAMRTTAASTAGRAGVEPRSMRAVHLTQDHGPSTTGERVDQSDSGSEAISGPSQAAQ